ncbi:MAG: hypothetical protein L6Q29_01355 [Candidatus Pacebacteria bacterium]|nr:hypothetical protein [Candidatus Paceibacterota bacterium]NUQ57243.1 hypothetical protein [Candidatus Paceibacter sp.]
MNDRMGAYGSLVKLGKSTAVEDRYIDVYTKGMVALKQRYFFYKGIVAGRIEYSPEMGTASNYKDRALSALQTCHRRAVEIKEKINRLVSVEIPERYKRDFETLLYYQDRKEKEESSFMKEFCDIGVSQRHVFDKIDNGIVSDCEILGFCVCRFGNASPYMGGCVRSNVDMLDDGEAMKRFKEGSKLFARWLGETFGPQAKPS